MVLKSDQERVKALLSETITLLCRNGLHFQSELSIEALIGITLDHDDVFLVSVKENIQPNSNSVDSPNSVDVLRKQKHEDSQAIQLDSEPGELSAVSDSTHAGSGTSLSHCAGQQLMFYPDNAAGEKVTESQKKKRCRTIDVNSDGRAIKSAKPADGHNNRSRVEAQIGSDVIIESVSSLSNPERAGTRTTQSDGSEVFARHEEAGTKSDIFGEDFGDDVIHIKEEAFSVDDGGMQYYNPSASFSAYPPPPSSQFQGMTNDANPFDAAGHPFQVSEESAAHLVNEMHSQGSNSSSLSVDTLVVAAKSQLQGTDPRRHAPSSSFAAAALGQSQRCYRCQMCGTTIGDLNGYKEHIKRHRNIYKYYCNVCGKGFSASINLRGHLVKHTGVREFRCSLCPKDFAYKRQLERHLISAHPEAAAIAALQASTSSSVPFVNS